ncbi:CAP domain-containing protein [Amphibacillus sediminis]|uniref:CAP domain-containing protein n=1 Tax=Amphibacillus sediminis TaxID=360185 RepID=UPI000829E9AD|nr:CAP domain-containing protein [Amphibacillus sediminis]
MFKKIAVTAIVSATLLLGTSSSTQVEAANFKRAENLFSQRSVAVNFDRLSNQVQRCLEKYFNKFTQAHASKNNDQSGDNNKVQTPEKTEENQESSKQEEPEAAKPESKDPEAKQPDKEEAQPEKVEQPDKEEKQSEKAEQPDKEEKQSEKAEQPDKEEKQPEKAEQPDKEEKQPEKAEQPDKEEKQPETPAAQEPTENNQAPEQTNNGQAEQRSELNAFEQEVVELTNQERAKHGLSALEIDTKLSSVAREKSRDMASSGYFSHNSPNYGSPFDMIKQFGISYRTAGENIAKGQRSPQEVVNAWMNSEGHRANILNANYTHIGVGYVENGNHWTQMFIGK